MAIISWSLELKNLISWSFASEYACNIFSYKPKHKSWSNCGDHSSYFLSSMLSLHVYLREESLLYHTISTQDTLIKILRDKFLVNTSCF